jgi:hypothetical protein
MFVTGVGADTRTVEKAQSQICRCLEEREGRPLSDEKRKMVATLVQYFASLGERDIRRIKIFTLAGVAHYQWWTR